MRNHTLNNVSFNGTTRSSLLRVGDNRDPVLKISDPNVPGTRGLCIRKDGRVAMVQLKACRDASWAELHNDELLSMYDLILKYHEIIEVSLTYKNHCWKCKTGINGARDYRCETCRWYVCSGCGECGCDYRGPIERDPRRRSKIQEFKDGRRMCMSVLKVLKQHMREREMDFVCPSTSELRIPR